MDLNIMACFTESLGEGNHWIDNHMVKDMRYRGRFTDLVKKTAHIQVFDDGYLDR